MTFHNSQDQMEGTPETNSYRPKTDQNTKTWCNKILDQILLRLKNIENRQDGLGNTLKELTELVHNKTDIVQNQINLLGLISLASMHEMQLPIHRMGIIEAFKGDYSEDVTIRYSGALVKGLTEAISMLKTNSRLVKKKNKCMRNEIDEE